MKKCLYTVLVNCKEYDPEYLSFVEIVVGVNTEESKETIRNHFMEKYSSDSYSREIYVDTFDRAMDIDGQSHLVTVL